MTPFAAGLAILAQLAIPAPTGYVNDFARVLDPASIQQMTDVIGDVQQATRGEIAVVTLPDIGDRSAADVALQIGRRWGVGAKGAAGDPAKNLGVVVLVVPRQQHRPGSGQVFIATGRGAEGFLPDSRVGRIRDAMGSALSEEQYGAALALGVDSLAQAFAQQFGVTLAHTPTPAPAPVAPQGRGFPLKLILLLVVLLLVTRGRLLLWPFLLSGLFRGGGRGSGWGGGSWGGGGGFGGGFGGFGGGGGFSGGGAGGRF